MATQRTTVLHVDDDAGFTELVRDIMQRETESIRVTSVHSADEAVARLESTADIDCVVSDYDMLGKTGLDLLETVRERWPSLPFILFTGRGDEETAMKAINLGVTDYLQKKSGTSQYAILANRIQNAVAQHRAETALKHASERTEAQFELLVDTVENYAIFLLDTDGAVQTWNQGAEKIKGYTSDEIIGEHFSTFYRDAEVRAGVPEQNLQKAATDGRFSGEGWRVRKDGSEFWADVTLTALHEDGELIGFAKITRDETRQKELARVSEQNQRLHHIIAALSHDLTNPLTVASGNVTLAQKTGDASYLDEATDALGRAQELLDYLTDLTTDGREFVTPETVDLSTLAEAAWNSTDTRTATLRIEDDMVVTVDRKGLQQLLENLFRNAVEHGGSDVTVRLGRLGDDGLYVEDDGSGIDDAERDAVFELGYSGESDRTGFGLAICRYIAQANGWAITLDEEFESGARVELTGLGVPD